MKVTKTGFLLGLFWLAIISCPALGQRISEIQAKLFYENTGMLSENVLTEKGFDLWNTPFDSTYSALVIVGIQGNPHDFSVRPLRIDLVARYRPVDGARRQITVRQLDKIRIVSESGKAYAGFWLKDTGCEPVYLTARIVGRRQQFKQKINFGCGE